MDLDAESGAEKSLEKDSPRRRKKEHKERKKDKNHLAVHQELLPVIKVSRRASSSQKSLDSGSEASVGAVRSLSSSQQVIGSPRSSTPALRTSTDRDSAACASKDPAADGSDRMVHSSGSLLSRPQGDELVALAFQGILDGSDPAPPVDIVFDGLDYASHRWVLKFAKSHIRRHVRAATLARLVIRAAMVAEHEDNYLDAMGFEHTSSGAIQGVDSDLGNPINGILLPPSIVHAPFSSFSIPSFSFSQDPSASAAASSSASSSPPVSTSASVSSQYSAFSGTGGGAGSSVSGGGGPPGGGGGVFGLSPMSAASASSTSGGGSVARRRSTGPSSGGTSGTANRGQSGNSASNTGGKASSSSDMEPEAYAVLSWETPFWPYVRRRAILLDENRGRFASTSLVTRVLLSYSTLVTPLELAKLLVHAWTQNLVTPRAVQSFFLRWLLLNPEDFGSDRSLHRFMVHSVVPHMFMHHNHSFRQIYEDTYREVRIALDEQLSAWTRGPDTIRRAPAAVEPEDRASSSLPAANPSSASSPPSPVVSMSRKPGDSDPSSPLVSAAPLEDRKGSASSVASSSGGVPSASVPQGSAAVGNEEEPVGPMPPSVHSLKQGESLAHSSMESLSAVSAGNSSSEPLNAAALAAVLGSSPQAEQPWSIATLLRGKSAEMVAQILTSYLWRAFVMLRPADLFPRLDRKARRRKDSGPSVKRYVDLCNRMTRWIAASILTQHVRHERLDLMWRVVDVAHALFALRNYSGVTVLTAALQCSSVSRVSESYVWPSETRQRLDKLVRFMDPAKNFATYRSALAEVVLPSFPHVIPLISDAIYVADGNPMYFFDANLPKGFAPVCSPHDASDLAVASCLLNFEKLSMFAALAAQLRLYQAAEYSLQYSDHAAVDSCLFAFEASDEDLWEMSLVLKPTALILE